MTRIRDILPGPALAALLVLVLVLPFALVPGVQAEQNPYYIGVSEAYTRESNLLRLADAQLAPAGFSRGDSATLTALLAGLDKPFGRQHAYGNLSLRDTRYGSNGLFNNFGYTGNAGLDWSSAERVSGTLAYSANRSLSSFNSYGIGILTQKNQETSQNANASLRVGLVTQYSLEMTLAHRQVRNSLQNTTVQAREYDQDSVSMGLRWTPRAATTLGAALRETLGRYPKYFQDSNGDYQADRFKQPAIDLSASLEPSGASKLNARLSYSKTHYDLNTQRDFSGVTGSLGWAWLPRERTHLSLVWARDTGQNTFAATFFGVAGSSDYSQLNNSLRLQADYDATAKLTATSALVWVKRNIVSTVNNPLIPPNALDQAGKDSSLVFSIGARWAPLRSVLVGCDFSAERRTASGALTVPLHDNTFSCYGQFQLQQ